jgi:cephalosporin hydroxylase
MDDLYKECLKLGIFQVKEEFLELLNFLNTQSLNNVMEIGSKYGGSFYAFCKLSTGKRISLDLTGGIHGGWALNHHPYLGDVFAKRNEWFLKTFSNTHMVEGDSHKQETVSKIEDILEKDLLDFLMIDGDHTYEGVKQDYYMYKHLVRPGGWIGFHDINDTKHHRELNVHVAKLWNELKGNKKEFNHNKHWAGIGIIQNDR